MPDPEDTRIPASRAPALRTTALAVAAACAASCVSVAPRDTDNAPAVIVRGGGPDPLARAAAKRAQREEEDRRDAEADAAAARGEAPPASSATRAESPTTGTPATLTFHAAGCSLLENVPGSGRITFASTWDALDAGYAPCPACRPQTR